MYVIYSFLKTFDHQSISGAYDSFILNTIDYNNKLPPISKLS